MTCCTDGWTVVGMHKHAGAMYEEMGPCDCDLGKLLEFPSPDAKGRERVGPWGPEGYWRGRPHNLPRPEPTVFLSTAENSKRMRELASKVGIVLKPLDKPTTATTEGVAS